MFFRNLLAAAFCLLALPAAAQICSPNPNDAGPPNLVANCPISAVGLNKMIGNPSIGNFAQPFSADGAQFTAQSSATAAFSIYNPTGAGPYFDASRAVLVNPAGSLTQNSNGFGTYIKNLQVGTPTHGGAVGLFSFDLNAVSGGSVWGGNSLGVSSAANTSQALYGWEADFQSNSASDTVLGYILAGSSTVQPATAIGVQLNNLSTQSPGTAKWTLGFSCADGVMSLVCDYKGALAATGSNVASTGTQYGYRDGSGTFRTYTIQVDSSGNYNIVDSAGASAGHSIKLNTGLAIVMAGSFFPATATVAGLPTCNASTKGAVWVVTDQSGTPTYGGALTGGGTTPWTTLCNGTSWAAH